MDPDGAGSQPISRESYLWDGDQILLQFFDANISDSAAAQAVRRNLYGPAVDMLLATQDLSTGAVTWPLADWLGSTRDLVDSTGAVQKHLDYDSFGNVARVTNGSGQPSTLDSQPSTRFLYTGREYDR